MAVWDAPNAETTAAWDGPLFDRFVEFRHIFVEGLAKHGDRALELHPPPVGARALDLGCGFGDTTEQIAAQVGPGGSAHGVDIAPRFIDAARSEVKAANASFEVRDVQFDDLGGPYDYVFSRMGIMFFDNPGAAMRNVHRNMAPGARLVAAVWRIREDNDWVYAAQLVVEDLLGRPEEHDEPTCGPGPFSMSGADTTSGILVGAGFRDVSLTRCDLPMFIGRDVDDAVDAVTALGPAGELIRLWGERMAHRHDEVRAALREQMARFQTGDGIVAPSSTWIVSAIA